MSKEDLIRAFPTKRISPFDGMAITAPVWAEAHEYHRQRQQLHALFRHGSGILTGLEVIASDPPNSSVYILPGIAIDPQGQTIVLPEPMAYDVGQTHGLLYLLLTYGEGRPRSESDQEGGPLYVRAHFGIEATLTLPETPYVELARIRRQDRQAPILDAQDATHPGSNEIDLRFRREIGTAPQEVVTVGVSYVGGANNLEHGRGVRYLASALRRLDLHRVWVDKDVPLDAGLEAYTLVCLAGQEAFQLNQDEMNALYAYLQGGGTVFIESCRREIGADNPPADRLFSDLLASMGIQLEALPPGHNLLVEPFLFGAPPPGFETEGAPTVWVGDGVIFSTCDYGCLWQGKRRDRMAWREEIRSAMEWGANIVAYAIERRKRASAE